jgi:hypothetical protein
MYIHPEKGLPELLWRLRNEGEDAETLPDWSHMAAVLLRGELSQFVIEPITPGEPNPCRLTRVFGDSLTDDGYDRPAWVTPLVRSLGSVHGELAIGRIVSLVGLYGSPDDNAVPLEITGIRYVAPPPEEADTLTES